MMVSERIRNYPGWCDGPPVVNTTNSRGSDPAFSPENHAMKIPGPAGSGRSGKPRDREYEHTQRGTLIIAAVSAAIILMIAISLLAGFVPVTVLVGCILVFVLSIMSTLTVTVSDDALWIRFGPVPLIQKSWPVSDISSAAVVTNPWYYGFGIRWTPSGPLYNVSGSGAVEVSLHSGKQFRIGTDEPGTLSHAILETLKRQRTANQPSS